MKSLAVPSKLRLKVPVSARAVVVMVAAARISAGIRNRLTCSPSKLLSASGCSRGPLEAGARPPRLPKENGYLKLLRQLEFHESRAKAAKQNHAEARTDAAFRPAPRGCGRQKPGPQKRPLCTPLHGRREMLSPGRAPWRCSLDRYQPAVAEKSVLGNERSPSACFSTANLDISRPKWQSDKNTGHYGSYTACALRVSLQSGRRSRCAVTPVEITLF